MTRIEPAPSVFQYRFCPRERRRLPHAVQTFTRTRYTIKAPGAKPSTQGKRRGLWGALAHLFRGTA